MLGNFGNMPIEPILPQTIIINNFLLLSILPSNHFLMRVNGYISFELLTDCVKLIEHPEELLLSKRNLRDMHCSFALIPVHPSIENGDVRFFLREATTG